MNKNNFVLYLSGIAPLSGPLKQELFELLHEENYKPRQILFSPGQQENRLCFIQNGFARNYYYDAFGNDQTVRFWHTGDILLSYQGYWGQPAYFYTEIMEATKLVSLKYDDLRMLLIKFPETAVLVKTIVSRYHQEENQKQRLISLSAEQRFREMRKNNRLVFQKAPLKIIASYLNMSRETLSRMISKG
ncbi:Crp/Fnr family transcriptional regulator [Mucilaginibacter xinganensis]|uniref:Transcriptional regulator, Crp/Fnr family, putative n=1 Tax=Mucilaginibacter xinganensis TaxID=1234841 RepID=A0A223NRT0_9SPHI|nr:Crp/Fnr family transcriptional regulator [Mucilaginibacter xinganensis]ASU32547.1 transcriptional regulator, Crp/Fnr family, putative [Mucilaginibacter xinganensis]